MHLSLARLRILKCNSGYIDKQFPPKLTLSKKAELLKKLGTIQ
jgi:hypothetical protein